MTRRTNSNLIYSFSTLVGGVGGSKFQIWYFANFLIVEGVGYRKKVKIHHHCKMIITNRIVLNKRYFFFFQLFDMRNRK